MITSLEQQYNEVLIKYCKKNKGKFMNWLEEGEQRDKLGKPIIK